MVTAWGITGGSAGMTAQVAALADALGVTLQMKNVVIRKPFVWLPNSFYAGLLDRTVLPYAIGAGSDRLEAPWPDVVISCGRRGTIAALGLAQKARKAGSATRFINIQDPRIDAKYFDAVVAMEHDRIKGPNVIKTRYALHTVTAAVLAGAAARFSMQFAEYPKPHIAVLLGGSTNKYTLVSDDMRSVLQSLQHIIDTTTGSLLITPSRRTGDDNITLLHKTFGGNPRVYIYDFAEENPYRGLLALADVLLVTDDSVNMMSEAYATGKPLYILPLPGHTNTKPARFAGRLVAEAIARPYEGALEQWSYRVDNEMGRVAAELKRMLALP